MVSLVDIVPQARTVETAAGALELRGLGLRQIAELFLTFPGLRNLFTDGAPDVSVGELMAQAPDAIGIMIAAAAGQPEAAGKIVDVGSGLAPEELIDCVNVIYELTFPRGITPFLLRLAPLLVDRSAAAPGRAADMNMQPGPNGSLPPDMLAAK
jgi:hypothetical protein